MGGGNTVPLPFLRNPPILNAQDAVGALGQLHVVGHRNDAALPFMGQLPQDGEDIPAVLLVQVARRLLRHICSRRLQGN